MRRTLSLAAVTALVAGTIGLQATTAASQAAPSPGPNTSAVSALKAHPGAALTSCGTDFVDTGRIVDADGSTHVRMDRTYHGLKVLGGDLVVHRGPDGQWRGVGQTLQAPVRLATTPRLTSQRARTIAVAPTRLTRGIDNFKAAGRTCTAPARRSTTRLPPPGARSR